MPLYIGDYLKDTGRLSTEAHGAYILLMVDYWANGAPPLDDDEELSSITRMPLEGWKVMRTRLERYFQIREGKWFHGRIELELQEARGRAERARINGKNGGRPPKDETQQEPSGFSLGSENEGFGNPGKSSSQSQSPSPASAPEKKNAGTPPSAAVALAKEHFEKARLEFLGTRRSLEVEWENFYKKNGRAAFEIAPLLLAAVKKEKRYKDECSRVGAFVPAWAHFSTWINQKRWGQEFPTEVVINGR